MKKTLWLVALVLASAVAGTAAAESSTDQVLPAYSHAQQDQMFVRDLARLTNVAAPEGLSPVPAPSISCANSACQKDADCSRCLGDWYCSGGFFGRCTPY